jgi:hypothetical protein
MSAYVPTTEQIRTEWALSNPGGSPSTIMHAEAAFDRWLAAHDAAKRTEWEAEASKDERLVRYMAMATPLGYQSALTVVQEMTKMLAAEDIARRDGLAEQGETEWEYGTRCTMPECTEPHLLDMDRMHATNREIRDDEGDDEPDETLDDCAACDTPLSACGGRDAACCDDCTHSANWAPVREVGAP